MNKVGDHMSTTLYSVSPGEYAHEAVSKMYNNNIGALLVKEGEDYVGMFTKTDWMLLVLRGENDPKAIVVSAVMTELRYTIDGGQTVAEACVIMEKNHIRHLPVTKDKKIVGMFSVKDLEKYYLQLHKKTDF
ncbi:MAG: histidine kinase [Nitrospinaceae bacterium]|nr:MAG: histidine kinase [Nitrospinaceae bacterium]